MNDAASSKTYSVKKYIFVVVSVRLQVRLIVNNVTFFHVTVCVCVRACVCRAQLRYGSADWLFPVGV